VSKVTSFSSTFQSASAFAQDLSTWTGTGTETLQSYVFNEATVFNLKFTCPNTNNGPPSKCTCMQASAWKMPILETLLTPACLSLLLKENASNTVRRQQILAFFQIGTFPE